QATGRPSRGSPRVEATGKSRPNTAAIPPDRFCLKRRTLPGLPQQTKQSATERTKKSSGRGDGPLCEQVMRGRRGTGEGVARRREAFRLAWGRWGIRYRALAAA